MGPGAVGGGALLVLGIFLPWVGFDFADIGLPELGSLEIQGLNVAAGFLAGVFGAVLLVLGILRVTAVLPRILVMSLVGGGGLVAVIFVAIKILELRDDGSLGVGIWLCLSGGVVAIVAAGLGLAEEK
jgi:hypothetical protein